GRSPAPGRGGGVGTPPRGQGLPAGRGRRRPGVRRGAPEHRQGCTGTLMGHQVGLPADFEVVLDRDTRVLDGGRTLLGGSPIRLLRLTARAQRLFTGRRIAVRDRAGAILADRLLEAGLAHPVVEVLPLPADPRCTYVVPVHDRPRELDRLLGSIGAAGPVIVVDDASPRRAEVR